MNHTALAMLATISLVVPQAAPLPALAQWGGQGNAGPSWSGSGNSRNFAGEIVCRSRDGRSELCRANTRGRVQLLQQLGRTPCRQGQNWRYDDRGITVRDGCQARFGYGYGNNGGSWRGFAGQLECNSENGRRRSCNARTEGRVELLRQFSQTQCRQNRNWGYDSRSIWVDDGCRARFGYGYGNVQGNTSGNGGGSNAGAVIGGVALAAGLVALLAAAGKNSAPQQAATPARLEADLTRFPADSRPSGQLCLDEATRQLAQVGGTRLRLDQVDSAQRSSTGWAILARATATIDGRDRAMSMDCRTAGTTITGFDLR